MEQVVAVRIDHVQRLAFSQRWQRCQRRCRQSVAQQHAGSISGTPFVLHVLDFGAHLHGRRIGMLSYGSALTESIEPGRHTLQVDNTLFKKTTEFVAGVDDHVMFKTANLAGWGTYSAWALLIGFLGAGPFYLMLEREAAPVRKDGAA